MIIYIKLKTGEDLVGHVIDESADWVRIKDPVNFGIDPNNGLYAKTWLMHSVLDSIKIHKSDTYLVSLANRDAIKFYNQFRSRSSKKSILSKNDSELLTAFVESKISIKH